MNIRYVGNMYETLPQALPHLDAKGIELVRRDQCQVTIKIQEKMLRLLFKTKNLSVVKKYLISQWTKIYQGGDTLTIKDFTFSKEVKIGGYSPDCSPPPGAIVAHHAGTLHSTVFCCIVLCRAVLKCTVLCCTVLYCTVM